MPHNRPCLEMSLYSYFPLFGQNVMLYDIHPVASPIKSNLHPKLKLRLLPEGEPAWQGHHFQRTSLLPHVPLAPVSKNLPQCYCQGPEI